jgi:acetolactate synthase-1/2/3 large subunit
LSWLDPGVFGTLGVGGGFALAAKAAKPGQEVWLIYGDGSAPYSMSEIDTCVRHGLPVIAVIGNNGSWAQIAREQVEMFGDDVGTVLRRSDYHTVGAGYGAHGIRLDATDDVPAVLAEARRIAHEGRPVVINAMISDTEFRKGSISM